MSKTYKFTDKIANPLIDANSIQEEPPNKRQRVTSPHVANKDKLNAVIHSSVADQYSLDLERLPVCNPTTTVQGSEPNSQRPKRKTDFAFCRVSPKTSNTKREWSEYVIVGELKASEAKSNLTSTWLSLASYAREVFGADGTRQRVLGFTLCGDLLRIFQFDRSGAIASEPMKLNSELGALEFLKTFAYFITAPDSEIGFDTSFNTVEGKEVIRVETGKETKYIRLEGTVTNHPCISGRATLIRKGTITEEEKPVILKYSWPYVGEDKEAELLSKARDIDGVVRLDCRAKFYTNGIRHTVNKVVRKGLIISNGQKCDMTLRDHLAPSRKIDSKGPAKPSPVMKDVPADRERQCLVLQDFGKPIFEAESVKVLLEAVKDCLQVHRDLVDNKILHRDVNVDNILLTPNSGSAKSKATLIDLDHATSSDSAGPSGKDRTGTKFRSIRLLHGTKYTEHTYEDDVESFFWVLLWIGIWYQGPGGGKKKVEANRAYEQWNYIPDTHLGGEKSRVISSAEHFADVIEEDFTEFYKPLATVMEQLRKVIFREGVKFKGLALFEKVKSILEDGISQFED